MREGKQKGRGSHRVGAVVNRSGESSGCSGDGRAGRDGGEEEEAAGSKGVRGAGAGAGSGRVPVQTRGSGR